MEKNSLGTGLLPVVSGVLKIVSYLLLIAAVVTTIFLIFVFLRTSAPGGIWYLLDEMDDQLVGAFLLWGGFIISRYVAGALRSAGQQADNQ